MPRTQTSGARRSPKRQAPMSNTFSPSVTHRNDKAFAPPMVKVLRLLGVKLSGVTTSGQRVECPVCRKSGAWALLHSERHEHAGWFICDNCGTRGHSGTVYCRATGIDPFTARALFPS